ncbi:MAG TPA: hypothetical protein DCZ95_04010 [Verrucomicrobia bacterium]|nr:MAG: hypothetical protein A2X46_07205 [Lentisphaerae bacterium GWF2_57_35]HBA83240.1 hypothetical protein [Verrucomicrobiota bacterium]
MNSIKRLTIALAICATGSLALAQLPEDNLTANPGFESGEAGDWGFFGAIEDQTHVVSGPNVAHEGQYALQFAKSSQEEWGMVWQRLDGKVSWGDKITASAWIKKTSKSVGSAYVSIAIKDRTSFQVLNGAKETSDDNNTGWKKITAKFTIPSQQELPDLDQVHIEINIGVEGYQDSNIIIMDDVVVQKK